MNKIDKLMQSCPRQMRLMSYAPPQALTMWNPSLDVRNEDKDETSISVLDVIGQDPWTGEGVTMKRISAALRKIGERDVVVNINSPGGSFFEGLAIHNALKAHPHKVTVNVLGVAASAASIIAMAGDEVNIAKAGFLMNHNTMIGVYGNKETFMREAGWLQQFDDIAAGIYADRSGEDIKSVSKELAAATEDGVWLSGEKAVERGYADAVIEFDVKNTAKTQEQVEDTTRREVDQLLALHNYTRSRRKEIQQELKGGKPCAAQNDKPSAVSETEAANSLLKLIRQS